MNKLMMTLTHAGLLAVLAVLMGSVAYAEPNVGVCDVVKGSANGLYGLCVSFCEAQDCIATFDASTGEFSLPKNCGPSSAKTLIKYDKRREPGDPPMPCVNVETGGCPCWSEAEIDLVADGFVQACENPVAYTLLFGRDGATGNVEYAGTKIDTQQSCLFQEWTPNQITRFQVVDDAQFYACHASVESECANRGFPLVTGHSASTESVTSGGPVFLLIDGDGIHKGTTSIEAISFNAPFCGGPDGGPGDPGVCVNDDLAGPGVRTLLFTRGGHDITPFSDLVLPTGQIGNEGLFSFTRADPQVSLQNGATFTTLEFIAAVGAAADENNLDKIDGVAPLGEPDIAALEGTTVCAVVYDSDISVDVAAGFGSLKGATLGLTAFEVTAVGPDPDGPAGSVLPPITVELLPSADVQTVCGTNDL